MVGNYKRPESVLVVIYTADGDVLVMERRHPEGYWQSVTGSLEWGEQAAAAAVREVAEETGLDVTDRLTDGGYHNRFDIIPAWRERYAPDVRRNTEYVYRVVYTDRPAISINLNEHSRYEWLPAAAALQRVSSRTNREAISRFVIAD